MAVWQRSGQVGRCRGRRPLWHNAGEHPHLCQHNWFVDVNIKLHLGWRGSEILIKRPCVTFSASCGARWVPIDGRKRPNKARCRGTYA